MGCMVYGAVLLYYHTALYGAVWLYGAGREAGQCVTDVWSEIQQKYSEYSGFPYSPPYSCRPSQAVPLAHVAGRHAG